MNLAVLERLAREGDMSADSLRYLLNCRGECEWLDFKETLAIDQDHSLCDFTRDMLAIKNTGGGFIVVGVQDKSWQPVGISSQLPYDSKLLRDKIRKAANVELEVDIVHHELSLNGNTRCFAVIHVRASKRRQKRRTPTLVGKDFCTNKPFGLRRGEIFVRKGDSTVKIENDSELEDLLDDLETQADQDAVIGSDRISPFAVEDGLYRLLEKGYEHFIGRTQLRSDLITAITKDPRIWIINVHGPGGVGKSAIVNWAVYELYQSRTFESIIHLTGKETVLTPSGIKQYGRSLYSLENLLDHILLTFQESPPDELELKKKQALEILAVFNTLLVLDNMETVQDGRILKFVQDLPVGSKAKVLLTSRHKTGNWELPFPINELSIDEVREFINIRSCEMSIELPPDADIATKVRQATGGLPLAIQWLLGRFKLNGNLAESLQDVSKQDSPVLEFSFRNIWGVLSPDARTIMAILTIFDEPPTAQQIAIASEYPIERIERALTELGDVTLVTHVTQTVDGRVTYHTLPITLSFARNQFGTMGDLEAKCRQRYRRFTDQMKLHEAEISRFQSRFEKYGLESDADRQAAILCQKGESEMFFGNVENADLLFKQARELAPRCAYVHAMGASYELARNRIGAALNRIDEACQRATRKNGALCYTIKARIHEVQRDLSGRVGALSKALEYDPQDYVVRHQYGVALSLNRQTEEAIKQFSVIIDAERNLSPPSLQLLMALKTRMINLRRLNRMREFQEDVLYAANVFKEYPHLSSEARHFNEFFAIGEQNSP